MAKQIGDIPPNDKEQYELFAQSPMLWLQQAEFLKMSATLVLKKIGSSGIPVVTGQNSLSRRAKPLEILG
jgi:hypothetical protein